MTFQLSWEIEGEKQLSRRLRGINAGVSDLRKPFKRSARRLVKTFSKKVFRTKGAVIGERWARLSPATVAAKARSGFPSDPLVKTRKMQRAFRSLVTSDQAVIFNNTSYFKYHQSNRPRKKLPRRIMMKLGETQRQEIVKIFHTYIRNITK